MKRYYFTDAPIKIFGVPHFEVKQALRRLPEEIAERYRGIYSGWPKVGLRTPGARMCFCTDSPVLRIGVELLTLYPDVGMSLRACQGAHVLVGDRREQTGNDWIGPRRYAVRFHTNKFRLIGMKGFDLSSYHFAKRSPTEQSSVGDLFIWCPSAHPPGARHARMGVAPCELPASR